MKYNQKIFDIKFLKKNIYLLLGVVICILFYMFYKKLFSSKEGFVWSQSLLRRFNEYQQTVNENNIIYDLQIVQEQASPLEAEELLVTGYWPWSQDTETEYAKKIQSSTIINYDPDVAVQYGKQYYTKRAADQLISWNTKEGEFIIFGGDLGVTEGMPQTVHNTLKCTKKGMEKTTYLNYDLWNGYKNIKKELIESKDIPNVMPGFQFIKEPCNPCGPLESPAKYNCPFTLNIKGDNQVSSIWKKLWKI